MTRQRITITLKKDILDLLDNMVDGSKIRNRSHAIEYILTKNLIPSSTKVLVLAGGPGIKLRPITYELPKCLIPIHGRPLLERTFDSLRKSNLKDVLLAVGYLGEKIKSHFGDGAKFNMSITYQDSEGKKLGTVSPLIAARKKMGNSPFIVIYGDVMADIDYIDLLEFHKSHRGLATMALTSVEAASDWGVVSLQGSRIVNFEEKPKTKVSSHLINAGIYVFNPSVFNYLSKKQRMLEHDLFPRLANEGKLYGYPFEGQWYDVGTPETYEKVIKEWKE